MARVAILLLAACAAYSQSVEIAFTNSVTRAPIADLTVTLRGPAEYTVTTDAAGVARIPKADPGYYRLAFKTSGFMPSGKTRGPIHVRDESVRVAFEMTPYGKLQGRVLFANGAPAREAQVVLSGYRREGNRLVRADNQGRFVFDGVFPGRFLLAASPPLGAKSTDGEAWAPTWYPDAADRASAQPVVLRPGAEVSGYEIRLRSVPAHRVRGVVRDDLGRPAAGAVIHLLDALGPLPGQWKIAAGEDGAFDVPGVHAGEWRLVANLTRGGVECKGVEPLVVSRRDIEGIEIRLARPFTVEAFVDYDEPDDSPAHAATAVSLIPEPARPELQALAFHHEDGTALLKNVYPGRYEIATVGRVPGLYLDSVKLGDRDVLGQTVEIFEGVPPIRVVFRSGAPAVRARVENGEGALVVLVPQNEALRTDQFIRSGSAGADGRAEVGSLRPGDYFAFAFDRFDRAALEDPAFLRGLVSRAEKVHVEKGETASVSLKVTPWPE